MVFELDGTVVTHTRTVFTFWGAISDIGGIYVIFSIALATLIAPFSEHSFLIKAFRKLYLFRTADTELFEEPKSDQISKEKNIDREFKLTLK